MPTIKANICGQVDMDIEPYQDYQNFTKEDLANYCEWCGKRFFYEPYKSKTGKLICDNKDCVKEKKVAKKENKL